MPYLSVAKVQPSKLNAMVYYSSKVLGIPQEDVAKRLGVTVDDVRYHVSEFNRLTTMAESDLPISFAKTNLIYMIPRALRATEILLTGGKRAKSINSDAVFKFWETIGVKKQGNAIVVQVGSNTIQIDTNQRFAEMLQDITEAEIVPSNDANVADAQVPESKEVTVESLLGDCLPAVCESIDQQLPTSEPIAPHDDTLTSTSPSEA